MCDTASLFAESAVEPQRSVRMQNYILQLSVVMFGYTRPTLACSLWSLFCETLHFAYSSKSTHVEGHLLRFLIVHLCL